MDRVGPQDETYENLSAWLRQRLKTAGVNCAQLGARVGYHPTTVSRAVTGRRASWSVVERIVRETGPDRDIETARHMWVRVQTDQCERRAREAAAYPPVDIDDEAALCRALNGLWRRSGVSQREIVRRDDTGILRRSTIGAALRGDRVPGRRMMLMLVRTCGGGEDAAREWATAWDRLHRARQQEFAARKRARYQEAVRRYGRAWAGRTLGGRWWV